MVIRLPCSEIKLTSFLGKVGTIGKTLASPSGLIKKLTSSTYLPGGNNSVKFGSTHQIDSENKGMYVNRLQIKLDKSSQINHIYSVNIY
ncbi:hypothetical protein Bhyg_16869 [Pseudolycoriella hygida]|uniref:Uncharacterized protein n=1 Tax=Pseudolycoriella hygida TaxID=35572 RepID=A0A9Q0MKH0_9DIPT|nr:hypothetical protein Bhyg_16869 [Pseudolycoriella hygida]